MKLLLIEPSNRRASAIDRLSVPPLSLEVLAACTPPEWEVAIVQEPHGRVDFDCGADLVGITAGTTNAFRGYEIADEFRKRGTRVVMGGIHPTVLPAEALEHCDSVCVGEAELIWADILADHVSGRLRKRYAQDRPTDLSRYVRPRRGLLPGKRPFMLDISTVETSRGCPYACEFCSASAIYGRRVRERPMESLLPEIEETEAKNLFFVDNNIVTSPGRAKKLFREIAPLSKRWAAQASLSFAADPELVRLAALSGCFGLFIGLESVVAEGFNSYHKNTGGLPEMRERLRALRDSGISVHASLIFGNDFETVDSMRRGLDMLMSLEVVSATFGILTPLPGTAIAARMEAEGRILSKEWDCYDLNHLVFVPKNIPCGEFISEMRAMRRRYFSPAAMGGRSARSAASFPLAFAFNSAIRAHHDVRKAPFLAGRDSRTNTP